MHHCINIQPTEGSTAQGAGLPGRYRGEFPPVGARSAEANSAKGAVPQGGTIMAEATR